MVKDPGLNQKKKSRHSHASKGRDLLSGSEVCRLDACDF